METLLRQHRLLKWPQRKAYLSCRLWREVISGRKNAFFPLFSGNKRWMFLTPSSHKLITKNTKKRKWGKAALKGTWAFTYKLGLKCTLMFHFVIHIAKTLQYLVYRVFQLVLFWYTDVMLSVGLVEHKRITIENI